MRYLILAVLVMISFPALAQDEGHTIRIIQEDGSVDVIDLRQSMPASAPEAAPVRAEPQARARPSDVVKAPKAAPEPKKAAVPKAKPKKKKMAAIPPPPPQPVKPPPMPVQRVLEAGPQGAQLHRGQAIAIALDYAPPSSDVEVFASEYEGARAFSVMFKVEDGYHEVLVDAQSGKVLESRKSDALSTQARPGHLPGGLR